jgi:hypothetical protein
MKLLKQSKPQCLLYAFAMILDEDPEILVQEIGHDGLEIINPLASGARKFRGHHHQELIDCCMRRGKTVTCIEVMPQLYDFGIIFTEAEAHERLQIFMNHFSGVLIGEIHALAWDHKEQRTYDPNGVIRSVDDFAIREFFIVI